MSYIVITKHRARKLANDVVVRVVKEQENLKNTTVEQRMAMRKRCLRWCIPLRLFYGELTKTEALNEKYALFGVNSWTLHGSEILRAAHEIKQLADESHDGLVRISTEHMKYLGESE